MHQLSLRIVLFVYPVERNDQLHGGIEEVFVCNLRTHAVIYRFLFLLFLILYHVWQAEMMNKTAGHGEENAKKAQ